MVRAAGEAGSLARHYRYLLAIQSWDSRPAGALGRRGGKADSAADAGAGRTICPGREWFEHADDPAGRRRREEACRRSTRQPECLTDKIEVYGSEKLAEWCNQHPAVAARWTLVPEGLWTFDDWARSEEHRIPFQASARIESDLSRARAQLDFEVPNEAESALHLHVRGLPGVGKTRFALELCRDAPWRDAVIYVRQADDIRLSELIDTTAEAPDIRLVVVADEAQPERLEPLRDSVGRTNGRVRLITVGNCHTPDPTRIPQIAIEPLHPDAMRRVVSGWYPDMPPEHVDFVMNFAAGYMKLGRLAADAVDKEPSATLPNLLARREIRRILDSLLGDGDRRCALRCGGSDPRWLER